MKKYICIGLLLISMVSNASKVDTLSIQSNYLHKASKFVVITPTVNVKQGQHFPVVYVLHGYSGNYGSWLREAPQLVQKADELGVIIVSPDGGFGSWYFDSPIDSTIRYESYITKELVPFIDASFPTIENNKARAITGFSMGGHGGLYLAIRNTAIFGNAGSICGGVDFRPFPNNWNINKSLGNYANNTELWDQNVVINLIDALPNKALAMIIDCGLDDFFLPVNRSLHNKLMSLKIEHDYTERPGAHNKAYWGNSIDFQLLFFKKHFDAIM